jgi:hypothetical protein
LCDFSGPDADLPATYGEAADPKIAAMVWYRPHFDDRARDAVATWWTSFCYSRQFRESVGANPLALRKAEISVTEPGSSLILP